jgi:hypothetical protein
VAKELPKPSGKKSRQKWQRDKRAKCCWHWRQPKMGSVTTASATNDYSHWWARANPAVLLQTWSSIQYREDTAQFLVLRDAERERLAAENTQAQAAIEASSPFIIP